MQERASGILVHPSCFPSRGGIGDLGPAAYEFLDFLSAAKQTLWQILPLGPTGYGNSPYSCISAFAGNPLLISLERLAEHGWIGANRLQKVPSGDSRAVCFEQVQTTKLPMLHEAAANFIANAAPNDRERFEKFCYLNGWWLEDYVLFETLRRHFDAHSWNEWPRDLAQRRPEALARARRDFADELSQSRALQFAFYEQWRALHQECKRRGIRIIGDVAIFVSYDSADVWAHPDLFRLNADLSPEVVAGVPPDYFSKNGQRWGNPLYRWDVLRDRGYDWWLQRMKWALQTCDMVRIDHFRGFESCWEIRASEETAINGRWIQGPADDFFRALRESFGDLPLIAEDLGLITDEVVALRERIGVPGMRVLQFGFGDKGAHMYLPHKYVENTVVYTGTHDNDTSVGWWNNSSRPEEREHAKTYFGDAPDGINWAMIRAAETSIARHCVIQLQDVLGLDSDCRMNIPSHPEGNWTWRYAAEQLKLELAQKLAAIAQVADREPSGVAKQGHGETGEHFSA
jgi:4-alpha-glucanotransferase